LHAADVSCLHTGVILNAAIAPFKGKGSDEQSLLRQVLDTFQKGSIVIGDAFFGTYFLLVVTDTLWLKTTIRLINGKKWMGMFLYLGFKF